MEEYQIVEQRFDWGVTYLGIVWYNRDGDECGLVGMPLRDESDRDDLVEYLVRFYVSQQRLN